MRSTVGKKKKSQKVGRK